MSEVFRVLLGMLLHLLEEKKKKRTSEKSGNQGTCVLRKKFNNSTSCYKLKWVEKFLEGRELQFPIRKKGDSKCVDLKPVVRTRD